MNQVEKILKAARANQHYSEGNSDSSDMDFSTELRMEGGRHCNDKILKEETVNQKFCKEQKNLSRMKAK